jgi:hypothetical protein
MEKKIFQAVVRSSDEDELFEDGSPVLKGQNQFQAAL